MNRLFLLPEYNNEDQNNRAQTLNSISAGVIVLSFLFILVVVFIVPDLFKRALLIAGFIILICLGVIALIQQKKLDAAGNLFTFTLWIIVTAGVITAGGVSAPITIGYLIVILVGGLVSKKGSTIYYMALLCISTGFAVAYAESRGVLPKAIQYYPLERIIVFSFFFLIAMMIQSISIGNIRKLINRAQTSEMRYRTLLENIPTTTYINSLDLNSSTEYVSLQVEQLLGYSCNDFINDPLLWTKILHPEDAPRVQAESRRTSETLENFNMEYRILARDHKVVWVKDEATLVRDDQGKPLYWLGVWTDITSQKQAKDEQTELIHVMTKRTIQLQTAAEVSRAASSILDLNILLPNVVDLIRSHFEYYYVGIFLMDETREWATLRAATGEMGKKMLHTGHRLKAEESSMIGWCIRHDEARIALDVGEDAVRFVNPHLPLTRSEIALPLTTHGEVIGAMTIQSDKPAAFSRVDVTALQTMADQIANAIENARLFTERVSLIRELETQNAELERFTYTVSHDLRSPLVTIRGFLGYLRQDAESGDMTRFDKDLKRIANAVDKMQKLLNELLELSRIGRVANPAEIVPFKEIIDEVYEMLEGSLDAGEIKLENDGEFPKVHVDRLRLVEVIQNLVSNAIKFMGDQPDPTIRIGMKGVDVDDKPIFYVQDNGIGIEPQYHERIFGLFNRLDPNVEGTGIGLTLVRRIIETHGGRIWVESNPGKGATFFFTLANTENK